MIIPEEVIIWHLYQTLRDHNRPFVGADPDHMTIVLLLHLLVETILVDRVLPPWVNSHSIIVNPMEGIGI